MTYGGGGGGGGESNTEMGSPLKKLSKSSKKRANKKFKAGNDTTITSQVGHNGTNKGYSRQATFNSRGVSNMHDKEPLSAGAVDWLKYAKDE